jgi:hypothetical protein
MGGLTGLVLWWKAVCIAGGVDGRLAAVFVVELTVLLLRLRRWEGLCSLMWLMSLTTALRAGPVREGLGLPRDGESGRCSAAMAAVGTIAACDELRLLG